MRGVFVFGSAVAGNSFKAFRPGGRVKSKAVSLCFTKYFFTGRSFTGPPLFYAVFTALSFDLLQALSKSGPKSRASVSASRTSYPSNSDSFLCPVIFSI